MTTNYTPLIQDRLHKQGKQFFRSGWYAEAMVFYRRALAYKQDEDPYEHARVAKLDFANACQMTGQFDEATRIYNEFLEPRESGDLSEVAQTELANLQKRLWAWQIPFDVPPLTADDQRLCDLAGPMLTCFPALFRPVSIIWVDETQQSLRRVHEIQKRHGGPDQVGLKSLKGCEAAGIMVGYLHLVMIKGDWKKATDSALRGLLAHELAHREVEDTFKGRFIDPNPSPLAFICNERLTDLLVIAKGYGPDLLESRTFQERIKGSLDKVSALTTPKELRRILAEMGNRPNF